MSAEPEATPESVTVVEPEAGRPSSRRPPRSRSPSSRRPPRSRSPSPSRRLLPSRSPEAAAESVTVAESEFGPEPEATPVEPEATLTKFVTYEPEPVAGTEPEAPAPGTLTAPEDPADAPTPAAPDAIAVTEEPANLVIAEDAASAAAPEAPVAQTETEPEQVAEEHPEA